VAEDLEQRLTDAKGIWYVFGQSRGSIPIDRYELPRSVLPALSETAIHPPLHALQGDRLFTFIVFKPRGAR